MRPKFGLVLFATIVGFSVVRKGSAAPQPPPETGDPPRFLAAMGSPPAGPLPSPRISFQAEGTVALEDLTEEALRNNRDIRAAQKRLEASQQRPSLVSSLPDPVLSFASGNIGNPAPLTTLGDEDMSTAGFSLMQEVPFPGKLRLQGRMAQKEADADWHSYRQMEREVVSQVKQAFYRLYFVHRAEEVVQKNKELLERFSKITEVRYAVGKGIQQDVLRSQMELTALEKQLVELEQQKASLTAKLNSLLNRPPESPLARPQDYPKAVLATNLEELYEDAAVRSPQVRQAQAMVEKNNYSLDLARKEYYPDFAVEGGWFSRGRLSNMWETRFDVRIPLYFWRKQRYAVRESANRLEESQRMYEAAEQSLLYRVKDDYLMAKASEQLMDLYSKALVPQATLALESAMASYQVGSLDFLSLLTNFQSVLDYEIEYYEEFARFHEALARLEEITERPFTP